MPHLPLKVRDFVDTEFFTGAALGELPGVLTIYKFGFQAAISTTERPIWDETTEVAYLSSPSTSVTVSSDDANDAVGGSGAEQITVLYLDGDWRLKVQVLGLNGTTGVTIPDSVLRVYRAYISRGDAAGEVYVGYGALTAGVPANILAHIHQAEGQTLMCVFTVPKGYVGLFYAFTVGTGGNVSRFLTVRVRTRSNLTGESWRTRNKFLVGGGNHITIEAHRTNRRITGGTDVEIRAMANTGTLDADAQFELLLFDEDIWT
jgi:hypothetical protein